MLPDEMTHTFHIFKVVLIIHKLFSTENVLKARLEAKKGELDEQLMEYINDWRKQRSKEEEELKRLKEKQAKRKEVRAEQEKKLAQQKVRQNTVPIDRILSVKIRGHGSQWISHKIIIQHPGQLKKINNIF